MNAAHTPTPSVRPRLRHRLSLRAGAMLLVLAASMIGSFVLLSSSLDNLIGTSRWVDHSDRVIAEANATERRLIEVQAGVRGYVLTGKPSFLRPLLDARRELPARLTRLEQLVADNPGQERLARQIVASISADGRNFVSPLLTASRAAAIAQISSGDGIRRVQAIREQFDRFRTAEGAIRTDRERRATTAQHRARLVADAALGLCMLLVALAAAFVGLRILTPLRRLTSAAERRAAGELGVRVGGHGDDELGVLAAQFDAMSEKREKTERELQEANDRFRQSFKHSPAGHAVVGLDGRLVQVNSTLCSLLSFTEAELVGRPFGDLTHPDDAGELESEHERLLAGETEGFQIERRHLHRDGHWVPTLASITLVRDGEGEPRYYVTQLIDLSAAKRSAEERRELDRKLHDAQRRESLGILAGGVAHDFNNLLMGILGNADLLQMNPALDPEVRLRVEQIAQSGWQAAELTRQMLAYSGRGRFVVEHVSLSDVVSELEGELIAALPPNATVTFDLAPDLPPIGADGDQIRQAVTSLMHNAAESLGDGGSVSVATGVIDADEELLEDYHGGADLPSGPYAYVRVTDTGAGMSLDTASRIFEPFFTTKFTGRGLGLSSVLGIVHGHGGGIAVETAPGVGTVLTIILPLAETAAAVPA